MECKKPENLDYVKIKSIKIKKLNGKWLVENMIYIRWEVFATLTAQTIL